MKTKKGIITAVVIMLVVGVAFSAYAKHFPGLHRGFGMEHMMRELDLSDAQKQQVQDILSAQQGEQEQAMEIMHAVHEKMQSVISATDFDEDAARAAYHEMSSAKEEMWVIHARVASEINKVLTPEQRERLMDAHKKLHKRMGERRKLRRHQVDTFLQEDMAKGK
ncbi:MAG: Spy/CpxP family protein refolding chaperone [Thermodesulfobacteriota bacterium]|nr:Spy/CpxP family protein refolding chaperone [Thermodesulfobacteriota bacterium]